MNGIYPSHCHNITGNLKVIPFILIKISYKSALSANKMVMVLSVGIKARYVTERAHSRNEALLFEQPECPVNGIERNGRNPPTYSDIDRLSIRMLIRARKLTVDLGPLVCCLEATAAADLRENFGSPVKFFGFNLHKWTV
jgi:hypothetical protein